MIITERNGLDASFYLNKKIRLIIEDGDKVLPRDGILKGFDNLNYYMEIFHGSKKGMVVGFLRTTVRRIEPLTDQNQLRGGKDS